MTTLRSFFARPRPTVAIEFAADRLTAVRVAGSGAQVSVTGYAIEPLPPGALAPGLNATNVVDREAVIEALGRVVERIGGRGSHAALAVSDPVAKVSLLRFDKVPARPADLLELIRWQVRKSVPFRIEDAQLTYAQGAASAGGREFVVAIARRDIVREYEAVAEAAHLQPGIVDLATFNVINAIMSAGAPPDDDWLLVHAAADYLSLAILRGQDLIFFRHRGADDEATLADVVHQTSMYYEDRLQGRGFARVVLAGAGRAPASGIEESGQGSIESIRSELEGRLETRVDAVDPRPAITFADPVAVSPALLDTLTPSVGLLLRERAA